MSNDNNPLFGDDDESNPSTTAAAIPAASTPNLMASLLNANGGGIGGAGGGGLFGDEEEDHEPPPFANHDTTVVAAKPPAPVEPPQQTLAPSLLMLSGLLPGNNSSGDGGDNGGGGGLFDEVDQAEQEKIDLERQAAAEQLQRQQQDSLEQQLQQQQQQQLNEQMQSVYLGNTMAPPQSPQPYSGTTTLAPPPPPMGQAIMGGTVQPYSSGGVGHGMAQSYMGPVPVQAGFYRDHHTQPPLGSQSYMDPQQQQMRQQQQMQQQQMQQQQQRYYQPPAGPSVLAGMHNGPPQQQAVLGRPPRWTWVPPPPVPTFYAMLQVSDPLLIPGQALFGSAPHWSYQIATTLAASGNNNGASGGLWLVRRRFRHVVALEDRLREECPGAVLPPRPDKHATRALEEASTQQSAEFALQRANELQVYLNQLINHPYAFSTHTLRLFLSLQDDLGTAWPEVSTNAFTRLANAGVGAAVKVSEQTQATKFPWQDPLGQIDDYGEEDAELMALASQEQVRMAAVLQAVPKLEGAVTLLREGAELRGATGMELSRLSKEVETSDKELSYPMELVAGGMLRSGRRSKRMALELAAAMETFVQQYKLCRYEKMAFSDRRVAIMRRNKGRGKADQRAHHLLMQQQRQMYQQPYGSNSSPYGNMPAMQNHAIHADTLASDAVQECNEIGRRVKSEVNRIAWTRRQEWKASVKVVASASKEAITENVAIWESVRESFLQAFPEE